jgi:hypothetical protein
VKTFTTALVMAIATAATDGSSVQAAAGATRAAKQAAGAAQDPGQTPPAGRGGARPGRAGGAALPNPDGMTPVQVEQLFDSYVVMQARRVLRLDEDKQFFSFMDRMQRLQMLRRRIQRQRQQNIRELRAMLAPPATFDENASAIKIKALDDIVGQSGEQIRQAYAEIDQVLTPRQRAQFRVFEEEMERQKLDMLARARQQARGALPPAPPTPAPGGRSNR